MKRLLLAGAAALSLTLGASACGSVDPNAAVVNGTAIKVRDIETDVAAIVKMNQQPGAPTPPKALPGNGVREVLSFEIVGLVLTQDPARPLTVDQAAVDAAAAAFKSQWPDTWDAAPAGTRDRLARAQAAITLASQQSSGQTEFSEYVGERLATAKVKVNARYGSWDAIAGAVSAPVALTTTR